MNRQHSPGAWGQRVERKGGNSWKGMMDRSKVGFGGIRGIMTCLKAAQSFVCPEADFDIGTGILIF